MRHEVTGVDSLCNGHKIEEQGNDHAADTWTKLGNIALTVR